MTTFKIKQPVKRDSRVTEMWLETVTDLQGISVVCLHAKLQGWPGSTIIAGISEKGIKLSPDARGFGIAVDDKRCIKIIS